MPPFNYLRPKSQLVPRFFRWRVAASSEAVLSRPHDLIAEAISLHDPLFRRLVIKLRARPEFNEDVLARLWPRIVTRLAAKLAKAAMPPRLDATGGQS